LDGVDGELVCFDEKGNTSFEITESGVMSEGGRPNFQYFVFDEIEKPYLPFYVRFARLQNKLQKTKERLTTFLLEQEKCNTPSQLEAWEERFVSLGNEGVCIRGDMNCYKQGRSTFSEQSLLKWKRWMESEGKIIGYKPWMKNRNESKANDLGYSKKSKNKEALEPIPALGSFIVEDTKTKLTVSVGSGNMNMSERKHFWDIRNSLRGEIITFRHAGTTAYGIPKNATFKRFRPSHNLDR
jgi:DNA ligase-1